MTIVYKRDRRVSDVVPSYSLSLLNVTSCTVLTEKESWHLHAKYVILFVPRATIARAHADNGRSNRVLQHGRVQEAKQSHQREQSTDYTRQPAPHQRHLLHGPGADLERVVPGQYRPNLLRRGICSVSVPYGEDFCIPAIFLFVGTKSAKRKIRRIRQGVRCGVFF